MKEIYLTKYSALPTNTQFAERGMKESGYVTLGRRSEKNRSILAVARAKLRPDALVKGRQLAEVEIKSKDDEVQNQLQGKRKTRVLIDELSLHCAKMEKLKIGIGQIEYEATRKKIKLLLTADSKQFKAERIEKKVNIVCQKYHNKTAPNAYERREGQSLTPQIQGKNSIPFYET